MIRAAALVVLFATSGMAWVEAVEFPWNSFPEHLWERELVWLKNIGIRHVSLPPAGNAARLNKVVQIVRRLNLEADLEGPVPEELRPLTRAHGGPLTEPVGGAVRIQATQPDTLSRERHAINGRAPAIVWSDVEDTIGANGFKAGAVNFAGDETPSTVPLRQGGSAFRLLGSCFRRDAGYARSQRTGRGRGEAARGNFSRRSFSRRPAWRRFLLSTIRRRRGRVNSGQWNEAASPFHCPMLRYRRGGR